MLTLYTKETTVKAIAQIGYGSTAALRLRDLPLPTIEDHQVLVRVHASSVNPAEWYRVMGPLFARVIGREGLRKPKRPSLGGDFAGTVEAVGRDVAEWRAGDEVFGMSPASWAEYAPARGDRIARKPESVSFEEAAAVPIAGLTALQALRDHGGVEAGQKVLINGAAGGVGTYAVQIAKALEADVTAVCSTTKVDLVRSLGADRVVDYTRDDFTRLPERHDVMLDIAGSRPFRQFRRVLAPNATVVMVGGPMNTGFGPLPHFVATMASGLVRSQRVVSFISKGVPEDLALLAELLERKKITSVIDRRYELSRVGEALDHLGEGHARGKIVITT